MRKKGNIMGFEPKKKKQYREKLPPSMKMHLIAVSGGRCEYPGCNEPLFRDEVTQLDGVFTNFAHIVPNSVNGPRGNDPDAQNRDNVNSPENFMVMCLKHHKLIDSEDDLPQHSVAALRRYKREHEDRIAAATAVDVNRKRHIVLYRSRIGSALPSFNVNEALRALVPDHYPVSATPIDLSYESEADSGDDGYMQRCSMAMEDSFAQQIQRKVKKEDTLHFSLFAMGTMPMLIKLGTLFSEKHHVDVYQRQRDGSWRWPEKEEPRTFVITKPEISGGNLPVLLLALTNLDGVADRVRKSFSDDIDLWILTVASGQHGVNCIQSKQALRDFTENARKILDDILAVYDHSVPLNVVPVMPLSACIEFGRIRLEAHNKWIIYNQNSKEANFVETITIE